MSKDTSKKATRLTLFALLALVVAIIIAYFATLPFYKDFKQTSFDIAVEKQEITKGKQRIDEVNQAYAKLRGMKRDIELLDVAVPAEPAIAEALIQINEIVNRSGLQIIAITPAGEEEETTGEVQVTLSVQGPFRGLQEFLRLSEKNLRPISVKSLNILAQEDGGLAGNYQLGLVYAVKEKAPVAGEMPGGLQGSGPEARGSPTEGSTE